MSPYANGLVQDTLPSLFRSIRNHPKLALYIYQSSVDSFIGGWNL